MVMDEYEFFGVETSGGQEEEQDQQEEGADKLCKEIMVMSVFIAASIMLTFVCSYIAWELSFIMF